MAFDQEGYRYRVGVDSFAEVSLISPRLIKEHWAVTNGPGVIMRGIGGGKEVHKQVTVPPRSQWGAPLDELEMFAAEPPNGVDVLMGLDIQEQLGAVTYRRAATVTMLQHKLEIRTAPTPEVTRRMNVEPLTVVATNAGCNFAYAAVRNAGLRVEQWYSVEMDPICKRVSETIVPEKQLVHLAEDTGLVGNLPDDIRADLFIDTSPCQPWSRCGGDDALGFGDARSQTFVDSHAIYNRLTANMRR